jgi:hypothetical protein
MYDYDAKGVEALKDPVRAIGVRSIKLATF